MLKIALIDDDPVCALLTQRLIQNNLESPCQFYTFQDPQEALNSIDDIAPNYLFLDIHMPNMTGWEFLEAYVRSEDRELRVYILSSTLNSSDLQRARKYQIVKNCFSKPVNDQTLEEIFVNQ